MIEKIIKRDGRIVPFDKTKIAEAIWKAAQAVGGKDKELAYKLADKVVELLEKQLRPGEIPTVEQVQDLVEKVLVENGHYKTAKAYITYRKMKEEIRKEKISLLAGFYEERVAKKFSVNAIRLMANRYLLKNEKGELIEGPKQMFERVAMLIVIPDILHDPLVFDKEGKQKVNPKEEFDFDFWDGKVGFKVESEKITWNKYHLERMKHLYDELNEQGKMKVSWSEFWNMLKDGRFEKYSKNMLEYLDLMVSKKFLPNSPTLFNAGARLGQLSACFVIDIDDDMGSIMDAAKDAAIIFKSGGGVGINYSKLRPEGDIVASTSGVASGPVSFMRIIDVVTDVVKQGGCVAADSLLFTDKGIIKPEEIELQNPKDDGPLPISVYDGRNFADAFIGSFGNSQELLKFVTDEGYELAVTYDELVATVDESGEISFKQAMEIEENDYLVLTLGNHLGRKIKLDKEIGHHFNVNKVSVPEYLDEDLAEILGYYMANGFWNNGRLILSSKNEKLLEYFERKIKKVFNLSVEKVRRKRSLVEAVWFSKDLEEYFEKRDWKKENSQNSFIPHEILKSEEKVLSAFLRGLFEGNGSVHSDGYPVLYSNSEKLIKETQVALLSLGIFSKIRKISKEKLGKLHKGGDDVYALTIVDKESVKNFLQKIGFVSEDKNKKVKKALSKKIKHIRVIPNSQSKLAKVLEIIEREDKDRAQKFYRKAQKYMVGRRILTYDELQTLKNDFPEIEKVFDGTYEKHIFVKVKKIEKIKKSVFHFETSSGRYVANGFLVHNKRRGANMGILEVWHPDIFKFIHAKEKEGVFENFNISVLLDDKFWECLKEGKPYALINPRTKEAVAVVDPKKILDEIATTAWKTADPGVLFLDNINLHNVQKEKRGLIRATNPCGEQPLYPYESCNLGSINLYYFVKTDDKADPYFDWDEYKETIKIAYRFLDNVIDVNKYPTPKIEKASKLVRRIGLGFMGLADMLYALGIPYNSEEGFEMVRKLSEWLSYYAMLESVERAKERGIFPYYSLTSYPKGEMPMEGFYHSELWTCDWKKLQEEIMKNGIRNVEVTSIAPTGSISMLFDVSSGIEPQFGLVFEKRVVAGSFYYTDVELEKQLKQNNLYNDELLKKISDNGGSVQGISEVPEKLRKVFVTSLDIPWWDHVRMQAVAQLWITTSISKTINMPEWVTADDVKKAYMLAHAMGCKGITIYREKSKSKQVIYLPGEISRKRIEETIKLIKNRTIEIMKNYKIEPPEWYYMIISGKEITVSPSTNGEAEKCPVCGSTNLVHQGGCVTCLDCGWSVCLIA